MLPYQLAVLCKGIVEAVFVHNYKQTQIMLTEMHEVKRPVWKICTHIHMHTHRAYTGSPVFTYTLMQTQTVHMQSSAKLLTLVTELHAVTVTRFYFISHLL